MKEFNVTIKVHSTSELTKELRELVAWIDRQPDVIEDMEVDDTVSWSLKSAIWRAD